MRLLFALDQRRGGVDPRHGAVQQKIPHGEVGHLPGMTQHSLLTGERDGVTRGPLCSCFYLFFHGGLLVDELVEDGAVLLVELLHLVDVAGHFVHGLRGDWRGATERRHLQFVSFMVTH